MQNFYIQLHVSKAEKYPAKQHAQRVAAKLGVNEGLIYLLGQYGYNLEDSDMPKTWRQRRYFYYCSGVDEKNACLTYDIAKDELALYIEEIDPEKVVWTGRGSTIEEAYEKYDVDIVRLNPSLFPKVKHWISANPGISVYILHPDQKPDIHFPNLNDKELQPAIDAAREIKDSYEIGLLRKANDISSHAHREILRNLHTFKNEADIQALFESISTRNFANKQAYGVIAGSGENASELHYDANNQPLKGRQLVCLDAGAEWQLYAADITRTFPISGCLSTEAEQIYKLVESMQEQCIIRLKPGAHMWDLHILAARILLHGLQDIGILKRHADVEEMFTSGTYKGFYPHGLGHHMGLDVHDILGRSILRYKSFMKDSVKGFADPCHSNAPALKAGMVITVEPGIYFNRYELNRAYLNDSVHGKFINKDVLERYWAVGGVRIEDDFLITDNGYENLTTAPKGEEALKIIRDSAEGGGHCSTED